jgi:hypothetical protein
MKNLCSRVQKRRSILLSLTSFLLKSFKNTMRRFSHLAEEEGHSDVKDDDTYDDNEQSSDHLIRHLSVGLVIHSCHECPNSVFCFIFDI